uniref:Uncharacterized protein n=1 Tax=Oryza nivara TaxID=4536 RepID=A0A0E0HX88_ORYNI
MAMSWPWLSLTAPPTGEELSARTVVGGGAVRGRWGGACRGREPPGEELGSGGGGGGGGWAREAVLLVLLGLRHTRRFAPSVPVLPRPTGLLTYTRLPAADAVAAPEDASAPAVANWAEMARPATTTTPSRPTSRSAQRAAARDRAPPALPTGLLPSCRLAYAALAGGLRSFPRRPERRESERDEKMGK